MTGLSQSDGGAALCKLFQPRSIALVGATERSVWSVAAHENLVRFGFSGRVIPVNPKGGIIHGLTAVESCAAVGEPIDAALLMVPEAALPDTLDDLAQAGVGGAVILSAGFAETGADGAVRQASLTALARRAGIRLLGPNCLGFANFVDSAPLWTTPLRRPMANPMLALVSQSGALASQLEQFCYQQRVALTHMISTGNEADIGIADAIEHLAQRPEVRAIALFLETVRHPAHFIRAAEAARRAGKSIVVLKVGKSLAAAQAAQAHTGSLVGNDQIFDAVCARLGIVRAPSLEDLIITADLLCRLGPDLKPGLGLVAMSGGLCEIAIDQAEAEHLPLPAPRPETLEALRAALPSFATPNNPLDVTGAVIRNPELAATALATLARDPGIGLVAFAFDAPPKPDSHGFVETMMRTIAEGIRSGSKPGLMLSHTVSVVSAEARALTDTHGIAYSGGGLNHVLPALARIMRVRGHGLPQPAPTPPAGRPISEREVLAHVADFGVSVVPARIAASADEAAAAAACFDAPVVLKILSPDIPHKTEVGGVVLGLKGEAEVRAAYDALLARVAGARPEARIGGVIVSPMRSGGVELFIGTMRDPQWGPAIAVGLGGIFVEALKDTSLDLLPLTHDQALAMIDRLQGRALLDGFRGAPAVDRAELARTIVAVGEAALALGPDLVSLEINPLLADGPRVEALDGLAIWEVAHAGA